MKLTTVVFAFKVKDIEHMVFLDVEERQYIVTSGNNVDNPSHYLKTGAIPKGSFFTADFAKSLLEKALK